MKPVATYQKLRGGYYTPKPIADFLANWAIQAPDTSILEPSCGDGAILEAAAKRLMERGASASSITTLAQGIEFDPQEAQKARDRLLAFTSLQQVQISTGDFFAHCQRYLAQGRTFDAIIGNPPFIRYQHFPENHRAIAFYLMQSAGLHPNRLTNSRVPFLVASTLLLSKTDRLAMVIPAELLQVNYAAELRYFLSQHYSYITLITFKKAELWRRSA
jgi:adenine-specific DNA-methyltransferase